MSTSEFPGFDRLFFLEWPTSMSRFNAELASEGGLRGFEIARGAKTPPEMHARWVRGRTIPEPFVHLSLVAPVLFSEDVFHALRSCGATGWLSRSINLFGKDGVNIPGYSLLVVSGRCGNAQYNRSEKTFKSYPAGDCPALRGLFFEESSWDGSDVFMCESERQSIFVTEKARDAIRSVTRKIKFPRLSDWEVAEFVLKGATGVTPRPDS